MIADGEAIGWFWALAGMILAVSFAMVSRRAGWRAPLGRGLRVLVARPLTITVLFSVIGPPLAYGLVGIVALIANGDWRAFAAFLAFAPLSYVFGIIPGVATGLAVGLLHRQLGRRRDLIAVSAAAGAATCGLAGVLMSGVVETPFEVLGMAILMAVLGGIAAALCGALLGQVRYLAPLPAA